MPTHMPPRRCIFRVLLAVLMMLPLPATVFLLPLAAPAQQTTGGITGVVADPQGGVLTGAGVVALSAETGLKRIQSSGGNGYYDLVNLPVVCCAGSVPGSRTAIATANNTRKIQRRGGICVGISNVSWEAF